MTPTLKQLAKIADIWATVDGCEGGDLMRCLSDAADMVSYSNAGEEGLAGLLYAALEREIVYMQHLATSEERADYGLDNDELLQWAFEEVAKILASSDTI